MTDDEGRGWGVLGDELFARVVDIGRKIILFISARRSAQLKTGEASLASC